MWPNSTLEGTMVIAHPLGVAGLILNMAGTVLLLWFPPTSQRYYSNGTARGTSFAAVPQSEAQRRHWKLMYHVDRWAYRAAMALLLLGFLLQLVDLLHG
jgi:hypothetical protein